MRDREIQKEGKQKSERQGNRKRKASGRVRDREKGKKISKRVRDREIQKEVSGRVRVREIEKEDKWKSERQGNRKVR